MPHQGRLLVIEPTHDADHRWAVRLRRLGYLVEATASAAEALRLASRVYFDLVLVAADVHDLDAVRLTAALKSPPVQDDLPVVLAGREEDAALRARGIDAGADDYVHPPIDDVDLGLRLRSQVRLRRLQLELRSRLEVAGVPSSSELPVRGGKVLVIDDDPVWRAILTRRLEMDGHTVLLADDLPIAHQMADGFDPDVIVIDLMLPSGSGLDFIRAQRFARRGLHVPSVLVVSGLDEAEGKLEALRFGADDYLVKPVDPDELAARVGTQQRRSRASRHLRAEVDRARRDANRDALTRLYNRRYLDADLARRVERAEHGHHGFSAVLLDIDHFKSVNDEHGHGLGDQVLALVAACLSAQLREGDLVCRYGGEEFCVVLPATSLADARSCAERLRLAVQRLACPPLPVGQPTVSLGVAEWTVGETPTELLERADAALYRAKRGGRNRVEVAPRRPESDSAEPKDVESSARHGGD
jgi:two-component system cell cycle response regulator